MSTTDWDLDEVDRIEAAWQADRPRREARQAERRTRDERARLAAVGPEDELEAEPPPGWQPLTELDRNPPASLLIDHLPPGEHTILYGPGDVGKGTLAADWIVQATTAGLRVLVVDYESHPGEWARRIWDLGGAPASDRVAYVNPVPPAYGIGFLAQHALALRDAAEESQTDLVVIDSISAACGGDPLDAVVPWRYQAAVTQLGRTTLSLAHVTKAHEMAYPFGSVMFHNAARMTYSLERVSATTLKLRCRKSNAYRKPPDVLVTPLWIDDRLREVGYVDFRSSIADRCAEVLVDGLPRTVPELRAEIQDPDGEAVKDTTLRSALNRDVGPLGRFTIARLGARVTYSLRAG